MSGSTEEAEVDYYALLNVSRHASRDEIKAAYTRLARTLHPDKYRGAGDGALSSRERSEAQELFILVDKAYKVLSNDESRKVYESYGEEGLQALYATQVEARKRPEQQLQLGTIDERGYLLREKLLGKVQLERDLERISKFNVRGAVQLSVDGRGVLGHMFDPPSEYDEYDDGAKTLEFDWPEVTGCVVQQSVETALSEADNLILHGQVHTRGNMGAHSVSATYEHDFSDLTSMEASLSTATRDPFGVSLKGNRVLDQYTRGSLELVMREGGSTGLSLSATRKLSDNINGALQVGFGVEKGMVVQLTRATRFGARRFRTKREQEEEFFRDHYSNGPDGQGYNGASRTTRSRTYSTDGGANYAHTMHSNANAMMFFTPGGLGLHTGWSRSFGPKSQGKIGLKLSTSGVDLELTSSRTLQPHTKGNVTLALGLGGVKLTVRYDRGGMRYVLPISLSAGLSFGAAIIGGAVPAAMDLFVNSLFHPILTYRKAVDKFNTQQLLLAEREKALTQCNILRRTAEARRAAAEKAHGLVILRARYGCQLGKQCDWRDVAVPVMEDYVQEEVRRPRRPSDWDFDDEDENEQGQEPMPEQAQLQGQGEGEERAQSPQSASERPYEEHPPNIDVTDQLMFLCQSEQSLELHAGKSKANLLGIYNPCLGTNQEPQLYIRYKLASWVFEITCSDLDPVKLPSPHATLIGNELTDKAVDFEAR
mmetsp:Transcript_20320/g.37763  ORF Transcript_20320/g.37763 Transcript_20320/m.37763 type:complete len:709 (-) Transcript_20320:191-2317(-)